MAGWKLYFDLYFCAESKSANKILPTVLKPYWKMILKWGEFRECYRKFTGFRREGKIVTFTVLIWSIFCLTWHKHCGVQISYIYFLSTYLYIQDLDPQHFCSIILEIISLLPLIFAATGWRTCLTKYLIMTEWKSIQLYFAGWANLSDTGHILGSSFSVVNAVQFPART